MSIVLWRYSGLKVRVPDSRASSLGSSPGWGHCVVSLGKTYGLLTNEAFSVKMAGYWPSSFFACL